MKKQIKKLVLMKETVRSLEVGDNLRQVMGGTLANTACDGCFSGLPNCGGTSRNTCGTRLC